jgi:hypothetical protein
MADNKITETLKIVAGEENNEPPVAQPAQNVVLDASTPSVRSIVRVVWSRCLFCSSFIR